MRLIKYKDETMNEKALLITGMMLSIPNIREYSNYPQGVIYEEFQISNTKKPWIILNATGNSETTLLIPQLYTNESRR